MLRILVSSLLAWFTLASAHAENVMLISVDTLRADHLSCYGYRKNLTPHFDEWARQGVLFEQAYSDVPLTLPAHSTMLTGTFPFTHGVRENVGFVLQPDRTTLAEVFEANGYHTAAFIGSYVLASEFGMAQGFQVFDEQFGSSIESAGASTELQRPAPEVTRRLLAWLGKQKGQKFFVFVHFYDPHMPRPDGYDAEVSRVDRSLGEIDAFLRKNGMIEDTDIVLTADHGEGLGDHAEEGHGFFVYDSTLHIPLIIRPGVSRAGRGQKIADQVSLADLMPTILQMAGLKVPAAVQGRSLLPLLSGKPIAQEPLYAECYVPELQFGWSPLRSIRLGHYKYIDAPKPELYDLSRDPGELRNLYSEQDALAHKYRRKLLEFLQKYGGSKSPAQPKRGTSETLEKLATLGYAKVGSPGAATRIDPKDRIIAFEQYYGILDELSAGRVSGGVFENLNKLEVSAPEMRGLTFLRAWAFELSGNLPEAQANYQLEIAKDPDNLMARARYARVLTQLHQLDAAEKELKEILKLAPSDYKSRNNLAGLYHMTGRNAEALEEVRKITRMRPGYSAAWQNLGNLQAEAGKFKEATEAFRTVIKLDPKNAVAHLLLSRALRAQGNNDEASREEERAYQLNPRLRRR